MVHINPLPNVLIRKVTKLRPERCLNGCIDFICTFAMSMVCDSSTHGLLAILALLA